MSSFVKSNIPEDSSPHTAADWIEFKVLSSNTASYNISSLARILEQRADVDTTAYAQEDLKYDDIAARWLQEIELREKYIGNAYPFVLEGNKVSLKTASIENKPGQYTYFLCLMLSHAKNTAALDGKSFLNLDSNDVARKYFQSVSTVACGGYIRGHSISFGFPRQNNTNFVEALSRVTDLSQDGASLRSDAHAASPAKVKDYEIDIISWIPSNDNLPGKIFFIGQVASGFNWRSKSLRPTIIGNLSPWIDPCFASHSNISTCLFIPFCLPEVPRHSLKEELHYLCSADLNNLIFYRYRIPYYVQRVMDEQLYDRGLTVEGIEDFTNIYEWVDEKINLLKT